MIIGKNFIILDMPKTGTQFRAWVARQYNYRRLCPAWLKRTKLASSLLLSSIDAGNLLNSRFPLKRFLLRRYSRMGIYQILVYANDHPEQLSRHKEPHVSAKGAHRIYDLRGKEILSVLRCPHNHIVSRYEWLMGKPQGKLRKKMNSFEEYIKDFSCDSSLRFARDTQNIKLDYPLGILSYRFICMYFKDPKKILSMSAEEFDAYCISDNYKKDMYSIKFFRTETMDQQLCEYLKSKPYLDSQIVDDIFGEAKPKNMSKKRTDVKWDEETKAYFEKTEKFYIRMVKELAPLPEDDF